MRWVTEKLIPIFFCLPQVFQNVYVLIANRERNAMMIDSMKTTKITISALNRKNVFEKVNTTKGYELR